MPGQNRDSTSTQTTSRLDPTALFDTRCATLRPRLEWWTERLDLDATLVTRLETLARAAWARRPVALQLRDEQRLLAADWFQRPEMIGYLAPASTLGDVATVRAWSGRLQQLGVRLLLLTSVTAEQADRLTGISELVHAQGLSLGVEAPTPQTGPHSDLADLVCELVGALLEWVNRGADVVRLPTLQDLGVRLTDDELAAVLALLRATVSLAAPGALLMAGPATAPDLDAMVFGRGRATGRTVQLAAQPILEAMTWSALAERDARLLRLVLNDLALAPAEGAWLTSARWPGELAWPIEPEHTARAGLDAGAHRDFLTSFWTGDFDGSFGRGIPVGPERQRVIGTLASLAGLEHAELIDGAQGAGETARGVSRIQLLHAIAFSIGGVPMITAGDELGLLSERTTALREGTAAPTLDPARAEERFDPDTATCRIFSHLAHLGAVRASTPALHAHTPTRIVETGNDHILGILRQGPRGTVLVLANLDERAYSVGLHSVGWFTPGAQLRDLVSGHPVQRTVRLEAHQVVWLSELG